MQKHTNNGLTREKAALRTWAIEFVRNPHASPFPEEWVHRSHLRSALIATKLASYAYNSSPNLRWPAEVVSLVRNGAERAGRQEQFLKSASSFLSQADCAGLAFKGPSLSEMMFGSSSIRHSNDIDLLVHQSCTQILHEWFMDNGYVQWALLDGDIEAVSCRPRAAIWKANARKLGEYTESHAMNPTTIEVEVHCSLAGLSQKAAGHIFEASASDVRGILQPTLSDTAILFALDKHKDFLSKGGFYVRDILDLGRLFRVLLEREQLSPCLERADKFGCRNLLQDMLIITEQCLPGTLPDCNRYANGNGFAWVTWDRVAESAFGGGETDLDEGRCDETAYRLVRGEEDGLPMMFSAEIRGDELQMSVQMGHGGMWNGTFQASVRNIRFESSPAHDIVFGLRGGAAVAKRRAHLQPVIDLSPTFSRGVVHLHIPLTELEPLSSNLLTFDVSLYVANQKSHDLPGRSSLLEIGSEHQVHMRMV